MLCFFSSSSLLTFYKEAFAFTTPPKLCKVTGEFHATKTRCLILSPNPILLACRIWHSSFFLALVSPHHTVLVFFLPQGLGSVPPYLPVVLKCPKAQSSDPFSFLLTLIQLFFGGLFQSNGFAYRLHTDTS